jgi:hypothetical protein
MRHTVLGLAALLLAAPVLRADIGPGRRPRQPIPPQPPQQQVSLVIQVSARVTTPQLIVPIQTLRAAPVPRQPGRFGSLSTIMVGVALAMSLAFSGLWLVKRRNGTPGGGMGPMLLAIAFLGLGATTVWADVRPPADDELSVAPATDGRTAIILAGLALTLAGVATGIWYARRRGLGTALPVVLALAVIGFGGAALFANAAPPRRPVQPVAPGMAVLATLNNVHVVLVPQGNVIQLIVPPAMKGQFTGGARAEPKSAPRGNGTD